ncbi:MAG TPA: DMT family transporter [Bacteroides sp.]|nr:DMT family transporter [Bacteroides sp.]
MKSSNKWLAYALVTTLFWGIWGALIEIPEKNGFPATLGFSVWAITMMIPAFFGLKSINWRIRFSRKSIILGLIIGFAGAGGQLILFTNALSLGPAYLIFPIISLSPTITILLSLIILKERTNWIVWFGIILALIAIPLLSYVEKNATGSGNLLWLLFALIVFIAWGVQAFFIKLANETMKAGEIFFYMMITGVLLIPVALLMTDFNVEINYGFKGMYLAGIIQLLNALGALFLVYAFKYGKAIVVSPLTNAAAPLITVLLSLILYRHIPNAYVIGGIIVALMATFIIAVGEEVRPVK